MTLSIRKKTQNVDNVNYFEEPTESKEDLNTIEEAERIAIVFVIDLGATEKQYNDVKHLYLFRHWLL
jgi:hypothetical protein